MKNVVERQRYRPTHAAAAEGVRTHARPLAPRQAGTWPPRAARRSSRPPAAGRWPAGASRPSPRTLLCAPGPPRQSRAQVQEELQALLRDTTSLIERLHSQLAELKRRGWNVA